MCAGLCCFGMYGLGAAGAGWLAHWRTRKVEADLGRPALPEAETALLFYAGASVLWLSAAVLALVGMFKRDWTRAGRNCFYILLAHFGLVTALATLGPIGDAMHQRVPGPFIAAICGFVLLCFGAACAFLWRWGSLRVARIEALPPTGDPPGAERYALYLASILVGMLGFIMPFVYREPQNVRVGVTALRVSMVYVMLVATGVCAAIPVVMVLATR